MFKTFTALNPTLNPKPYQDINPCSKLLLPRVECVSVPRGSQSNACSTLYRVVEPQASLREGPRRRPDPEIRV